jgi:predicted MFS family arabinose efflux permease
VSSFGFLIQSVAASWLMVALHGSPRMVAAVQVSTTLPVVLLSLLAGALADNRAKRSIMMAAQTYMLLLSIILACCAWAHALTASVLLIFTFLLGCGTAFNNPAWQGSIRDVVPRTSIPSAAALNSMGYNIARSVGPALGGLILATMSAGSAFAINACSYVGLIVVLARWRPQYPRAKLPFEHLGPAMWTGIRYAIFTPNLKVVLARAALFGAAANATPALLPLVASVVLSGGPTTYGLLLGAFGLGGMVGAWAHGRLRGRLAPERVVQLASLGSMVGSAVAGISSLVPLTLGAMILSGAGWVLALSTFNVTVQVSSPRWVIARTIALYHMFSFGGMAVGSWMFGIVADRMNVNSAMLGATVLQAVGVVAGFIIPVFEGNQSRLDLSEVAISDPLTEQLRSCARKVVICNEYAISASDRDSFLSLMDQRRRHCRRNGAHRWTIMNHTANEERWTERYELPSGVEYLRFLQRETLDQRSLDCRIQHMAHSDHRAPACLMIEPPPRPRW